MKAFIGEILEDVPGFAAIYLADDIGMGPEPRLQGSDAVPRWTEKLFGHDETPCPERQA